MKAQSISLRVISALTGAAILSFFPQASAATLTWDANGNTALQTDGTGAWLDPSLWWTGATNVNWTSGDNAIFGNGGAGGAVTLAAPTTIGSLTFNSFTGTYTLGTVGQTITLNNGITMNSGAGAVSIISPITLGGAQSWNNNSGSLLTVGTDAVTNGGFLLTIGGTGDTTVSSIIGGLGGLTKTGAGLLTLSGANTFSGQLTVANGTLSIATINNTSADGTLGNSASSVILGSNGGNTGTLQYTGANASSTKLFTMATGGKGGKGGFEVTTAASTLTLSGVIDGSGGLTKDGAGTLALSNINNSYSGTTTINRGTLTVTGRLNGATGTALTFGGTGTFNVQEAAGVSQGMGALTFSKGEGTVTSTWNNGAGSGNTAVTFASLAARTLGATANFTLAGTGSSASNNKIALTSTTNAPLTTTSNDSGMFFGGSKYARYSTANGTFQGVVYGTDTNANASLSGGANTTLGTIGAAIDTQFAGSAATASTINTSAANNSPTLTVGDGTLFKVGQAISGTGIRANTWVTDISGNTLTLSQTTTAVAANATITPYNSVSAQTTGSVNTVNLSGLGASLTLAANQTLSVNGILRSGGTAGVLGVISGGSGIQAVSSGGEIIVRNDLATDITEIKSVILNNGGSSLTKTGLGTLVLTGANTYAGNTYINAGTLQIGYNGIATGGNLGNGDYAGNIYIASGATLLLHNNAAQTLSGAITGDGDLTKQGGGTLTLSGSSSYTGKTTITSVNTFGTASTVGTVTVSSFNSVFTNATLGTVHSATSSLGAPVTVANGTIQFGSGGVNRGASLEYVGNGETTDRVINNAFNSGSTNTITANNDSGLLKFTSAFTMTGATNGVIILAGSGNAELVQGLNFTFNNFTKSGGGTWTLGGEVGNTGITTVSLNGGTLALQQKSSLLAGNTANWTAAKVIVNSGGTLALNVGGAGQFANSDVTTLLTNIDGVVNNNGLRAGSTIGFDTTNAVGTFTVGDAIANTTGTGGGAVGLTKLGTGTLALTNTNTYTGATTVSAGKLAVNGSLGNTAVTVQSGATLQGSGVIAGSVTIQNGGTLATGNSIESLGTGDLALNANSTLAYELQTNLYTGTPNVAGDLTFVTGNLDITAGALLTLTDLAASTVLANNSSLTLLSYTGTWNGGLFTYNATTLNDDSTFVLGSNTWRFNYNDTLEGANYTADSNGLFVTMTVIPEPRSALLVCLGLLLLLRRRR